MKVVINSDYGGFSLSDEAIEAYAERKGLKLRKEKDTFGSSYYLGDEWFNCREIKRSDSDLVAVVESLGEKANGFAASLKVVEIPEDVDWYIEEYDGNEWVAEKHRTWM